MPQSVADKEWQSTQLKRWGPVHVQPVEVMASYEKLERAALVLGRDDLAAELSSRVTPKLCRKYAPLLQVLRLLTREPLTKPMPSFLDNAMSIVAQQATNPQDIWRDAMEGLETPELFEYDESDAHDSDMDEEVSSKNNGNGEKEHFINDASRTPTPSSNNGVSQELQTLPHEYTIEPVATLYERYRMVDLSSHVPYKVSGPIPQSQIVKELMLYLQKYPCLEYHDINGITQRCSNSVWSCFGQLAESLWSLQTHDRGKAIAEVQELTCTTVVNLYACVEQIVYKYKAAGPCEHTDIAIANSWLGGDMGIQSRVHDVSSLSRETLVSRLNVHDSMRHEKFVDAVVFAIIAREVYGAEVPKAVVRYKTPLQYARSISRIYIRNADIAMRAGLRDSIIEIWNKLSSVYLAQDPRMLMFLYELLSSHQVSGDQALRTRYSITDATDLFRSIWPEANVSFSEDIVPELEIEMPTLLSNLFGQNLSSIFSPGWLKQQWLKIVNAFEAQAQEVELEMVALTHDIQSRISKMKVPEKLLLDPNLGVPRS